MAARSDTADREFVISRVFDAPRQTVYKMWTEPAHLTKWWGPKTFTNPVCELDVRPGGTFHVVMRGPDGSEFPFKCVYREVVPPERLVYTDDCTGMPDEWYDLVNPDRDKRTGRPAYEVVTTVTFEDLGGKTKLTVRMICESLAVRDALLKFQMAEGWGESFEKLEQYVATATGQVFEVTRLFDAPRELVYRAWTEQDRLAQWWGPKGFAMLSCKLDLRAGGVFHYGMRGPDGKEMWGKWVFREVSPPDRLAFVSSFSDKDCTTARAPFSEDWPVEVLSTVTFAEQNGKTTLRMTAIPIQPTDAERKLFDAMHASMTQGWGGTLDQLAAFLAMG